MMTQAINARKTTLYEAFGEVKSLSAWARDARCLVNKACLEARVKKEWEPERALSTPLTELEYAAFGEQKTMTAWLSDPRCAVSMSASTADNAWAGCLERRSRRQVVYIHSPRIRHSAR